MTRPVFVLVDVGEGIDDDALQAQHRLLLDLRDAWALAPATSDTLRLGIIQFDAAARVTTDPGDPLDPSFVIAAPQAGTGRAVTPAFAQVARWSDPPPLVVLLLGGPDGGVPDPLPPMAGLLVCLFGSDRWAGGTAGVLTGPLDALAPLVASVVVETGYTGGEKLALPPAAWLPAGVSTVG